MGFIPKDREKRKLMMRIGMITLLGTVLSQFFIFSIPNYFGGAMILYFTYYFILPVFTFLIGYDAGSKSTFDPIVTRDICLKGCLFIELAPFILVVLTMHMWYITCAWHLVFLSVVLPLILFLPAILLCGFGGYYGAKRRGNRSNKK